MIWSHIESSHLLLASLRVQDAHYSSRKSSKDTSSCPEHGALLLIHALSECISCRSCQKNGEDTSICRNLEGMLVRHLQCMRSTSNPLHWAFEPNSLLLCGILPYGKMALKFCPSGERGGQQRGPGKSQGDSQVPRQTAGYVGTCPRQGWVKQGPGIG